MEERSVILVEPEIPENTGFVARLASNYSYNLRVVNPEFNLSRARETAKNAQEKLREAEIFDTVEDAIEDLEYVVGTKPGKGIALEKFEPRKNTSIMIGRESSGLTNRELEKCDAVVHIDTPGYESLNQSHATAIAMDRLKKPEETGIEKGMKQELLDRLDEPLLEELVLRGNPSRKEVEALLGDLDR